MKGHLQTYKGKIIELRSGKLHLSGIDSDQSKNPVKVQVHLGTNLPTSVSYRYNGCETAASALNNVISVVSNENLNLTDPEKEFLRWHQRLGHISFKRVQAIFRFGVLGHSEVTRRLHTVACKITNPTKCAACQFGKQTCPTCLQKPGGLNNVLNIMFGLSGLRFKQIYFRREENS